MKSVFLAIFVVATASAQMQGMPMGNYNLSTSQGIQQFLAMEGINPSSIITSNCVGNGDKCTPSGVTPCCLSPVFSCQSSSSGSSTCRVVPAHREHIPAIQQIIQTFGVTTRNPIT